MKKALQTLNKEQLNFICQECSLTKVQLMELNENELNDIVYETMCDIECAEVDINEDGTDSERCIIASDIVTILGNALAKEQGLMEDWTEEDSVTRIIICGGRDFTDEALLVKSLDEILPQYTNIELVSGHANGADTFGENYAKAHDIPVVIFEADWKKYGLGAGPVRNKEMLAYAIQETPVIIAFWDGKSKGTKDMINRGMKENAVVHVIRYEK